MKVLFVTSEMEGLYKIGGLGDVSRSLPVAIHNLRVQISVVMPYYAAISLTRVRAVGQIAVDFAGKRELVFVFAAAIPDSHVPLYLLRHPKLNEYHGDDIVEKFAFFSAAVARLIEYAPDALGGRPDIVHVNDWHTAIIPVLLGEANKLHRNPETLESAKIRTILTIHNLLYQGTTGTGIAKMLSLPKSIFHALPNHHGQVVKLLREGIEHADTITTVSPTYAKEILTGGYGQHVDAVLRLRRGDIAGILNGLDDALWDPRSDDALAVNFSRDTVLDGKQANKEYLQRALKLPVAKLPLIGFVGRLEARQKGIDILTHALSHMLPDGVQAVMLGTGPKKVKDAIRALEKKFPEHFRLAATFDERLARRIFAGADVIAVPSKFEPCGLTQMIAMRYGAIPIVRKTGGLADTVSDGKTGFVFTQYSARSLLARLKEAIAWYNDEPRKWQRMIDRCMRKDFSWRLRAREYKKLYARLT